MIKLAWSWLRSQLVGVAVYLVVGAVVFGVGFGLGWKGARDAGAAHELEAVKAAIARSVAEGSKFNAASRAVEGKKDEIKIEYREIVRTVDRIVEKPVYRNNVCLDDDGLRAANAALAGKAADPGQPHPAVPAFGAARGRGQRDRSP